MARQVHVRGVRRAALLLAIAAMAATAPMAAGGQGLAGVTLRPVENADTVIGDLIDHFVGGGRARDPKPVIDRVVVREDLAGRLVLAVTYSGLANCRLTGEVAGPNKRRQPQIQIDPVDLTSPSGDATVVVSARTSSADQVIDSAYLRLTAVEASGNGLAVVSRLYSLPKRWEGSGSVAPRSAIVVPRPIGIAAKLGSRPDYAPPPKVLVPMRTLDLIRGTTATRADRSVMRAPDAAARGAAPAAPERAAAAPPPAREIPPAVLAERRRTAAQTTAATAKLPPKGQVVGIDRFQYGVKPEDVQKGAQGPGAAPIELLEGLRTEDIDLNPALLLNIASNIYPDKNPNSGVWYYHPRSYHLEWTPEGGHGMRILYGAATTAGSSGDVLMAARLESGLDASEVQLATELLNAYKRRNPATVFTALRPLPLEKDGVDVSLAAVLGQYSIPKEKIAITGLSDVLGALEVSWITDPVTKENLQLSLAQDVGVNGMVAFRAAGGALAPQVPIAIQLADRDSFGRVRWNRGEGYRNITPYPVRLRYLHALVIDPRNNLPILYSWSLDDIEVAPQGAVKWDAAKVPAWIDTEAKRVWVDYTVIRTCDACDKQVLDTITGGVTSVAADQITFHTITPLADVGGYEITARVRSKYFDPKDRATLQKSVVLKADNQDYFVKPIYVGAVTAGEPLFEYALDLAMPDGNIYPGKNWIPSDGVRVLIGRSQLERSLGALPGKHP